MAIKAIALNDFYRPYFYKDHNGKTIKEDETFEGLQCQVKSPPIDAFTRQRVNEPVTLFDSKQIRDD